MVLITRHLVKFMRYHAIYECSRYNLNHILMKDVGEVERLRMIEVEVV